jgi:hypothetical protein
MAKENRDPIHYIFFLVLKKETKASLNMKQLFIVINIIEIPRTFFLAKRRNLLQSINNFPPEEPCDIELVTLYISANIQTKANIQNVLKHEEHNNKQIDIRNRRKSLMVIITKLGVRRKTKSWSRPPSHLPPFTSSTRGKK